MADKPLPGYDTSFGNKKAWVGDHFGPASYVTGGERFTAHQLGWGGIDFILPGNGSRIQILSMSRDYSISVLFDTAAVGAVPAVTIRWANVFGAEVAQGTDLSAEAVRLFVLGV